MTCPRAALFDLDDTLAESFQPPRPEMIERLLAILDKMPVAILTAAGMPRIHAQFLEQMADSAHIDRFYLFPNSAAQCFIVKNKVQECAYSLDLTGADISRIEKAIRECIEETGIMGQSPTHEPQIIPRDGQVAVAFLGLEANALEKTLWDPTQAKRRKIRDMLQKKIPDFEILIGGYTTIDITRSGIDKAYGVRWLSNRLQIPAPEMLYIGDALYEGGNDFVVIKTGIQARMTSGPEETLAIADELLASCAVV